MKKKLVCFAMLCATIVCSAASVDWKIATNNNADQNKLFYVFTSAQTDIVSALQSGNSSDWTSMLGGADANGALKRKGVASGSLEGISNDSMLTFVIVDEGGAVNGNSYRISNAMSVAGLTYEGATSSPGTLEVGSANFTSGIFTTGGGDDPLTPPGPSGDIPEPTSGLLLVMGGALLALRRKQK